MHSPDPGGATKSSSAALRLGLSAALVALAIACTAHRGPPPSAPAPPVPEAGAPAPQGPAYRIDAAHSELRILVYRAGALARFGHNHVLLSHRLAGELHLAAPGVYAGGGFEVSFPVADLLVDETAARREEGAEFATEPSAADIEGTRHNLLGPGVLDAGANPTIRVHGLTAAAAGGLTANATIEVRGHAAAVAVPVTVTAGAGTLTIRGGFGVEQSALGITPFSLALGALSVRDGLELRFTIVARAAG